MKRKKETVLYYLLLILTVIAFIFLLRLIKVYDIFCYIIDLILPIALGFIFAWIIKPMYDFFNKKINKKISLIVIILVIVIFYFLVLYFVIPFIFKNTSSLINLLKTYTSKLDNIPFLKIKKNTFEIKLKDVINSCGGVLSIIINAVLVHIFGIYILYNYDIIKAYIKEKVPNKYKTSIISFSDELSRNMRQYLKAVLLDSLVLFIITFITFSIIGLRYAFILSIFIALTNVVPFVGPYIGGAPAVLIALSSSTNLAIFILIFLFISQEIESDIINPLIMSRCVKINPLLIVITVTLTGKIIGIFGMLFAVPLIIFFKILINFLKESKLTSMHKIDM